ncbi:hypothetical protein AMTR_s00355p00015840, partial [Amborella trichopoda]
HDSPVASITTKEEHKPSPSMVVGFSLSGSISLVLIVIIVTVVLVKRRIPRCIRSSIPIEGPPKKLAIVVSDSTNESSRVALILPGTVLRVA